MSPLTSFIPGDLDIKQWSDIEPYFAALQRSNPQTLQGLKELIHHYSDTLSVFYENDIQAEVAYSSDTSKVDAKVRCDRFLDEFYPEFEGATNAVERKVVSHPCFSKLRRDERYNQLHHLFRHWVKHQCEENVDIIQETERTAKRCEELIGGLTVSLDGKGIPIAMAEDLWETKDRERREEIWMNMQEERSRIKVQLDGHFDALVKWRNQAGRIAGFRTYRQYEHSMSSPELRVHAAEFHERIKKHVVPLANEITQKHRKLLGLQRKILRPWDTDGARWGFMGVPPHLEDPRPLRTMKELIDPAYAALSELHPPFADHLRDMEKDELLDLEVRPHKEYGAFTTSFEVQRLPYISMQAGTLSRSYDVLIHELGHAEHNRRTDHEPLIFYREFSTDNTMAETASIGMELFSLPLQKISDSEEVNRLHRSTILSEIVRFLPWCALIDKFQQWIYQNPKHTSEERDTYFAHLMDDFYPEDINWRGLEKYRRNSWQAVTHIFTDPFYYIQYGFASLAALQLYQHYKYEPRETLKAYLKGLRMGAGRPYPEVWKEMGITLDFSPKGFRHSLQQIPVLMGFAMEEITQLEQA